MGIRSEIWVECYDGHFAFFYFELLRRGYDVAIGKVDNSEVDFIATKADEKIYVQVTESMTSEEVRQRELAPLTKINDNYEKIVLSMNPGMDS